MNRDFKIVTKQKLPLFMLMDKFQELVITRNVRLIVKHPTYYFFDYTSFRGVEVIGKEDHLKVRLSFFSSAFDYTLASQIINNLAKITSASVIDPNDEFLNIPKIWDGNIVDYLKEDISKLSVLLKANDDLELRGPFGWYVLNKKLVDEILLQKKDAWSTVHLLVNRLKKQFNKEFEAIRF